MRKFLRAVTGLGGPFFTLGAVVAGLLFGLADNFQGVLSIVGTPILSQFMLIASYLATIIAVTGLAGRVRAPATDGWPYECGQG